MNKILVVEDDETIRECIVDFLRDSDYLVDSAEDGAVERLRQCENPALTFLFLTSRSRK